MDTFFIALAISAFVCLTMLFPCVAERAALVTLAFFPIGATLFVISPVPCFVSEDALVRQILYFVAISYIFWIAVFLSGQLLFALVQKLKETKKIG